MILVLSGRILVFFYEGLNGQLRKMFSGTSNVASQITVVISMEHNLPILAALLKKNSPAHILYQQLTNRYTEGARTPIGNSMFRLGNEPSFTKVSKELESTITDFLGGSISPTCFKFLRLVKDYALYHSMEYTRATKRISYCVQYGLIGESATRLPDYMFCGKTTKKKLVIFAREIISPCMFMKTDKQNHGYAIAMVNWYEKD